MRSLLALLTVAGTGMTVGSAAAAPDWPPPVAFAHVVYDFGHCDTNVLQLPSGTSAQLDVTVLNQFDPDSVFQIADFLWQKQLPVTIAPQTVSVRFKVERPGTFAFAIIPSDVARALGMGCWGRLVVT
ncbi:hypothetical protein ACWCW7_18525 [Nocardia tengchongensis]